MDKYEKEEGEITDDEDIIIEIDDSEEEEIDDDCDYRDMLLEYYEANCDATLQPGKAKNTSSRTDSAELEHASGTKRHSCSGTIC